MQNYKRMYSQLNDKVDDLSNRIRTNENDIKKINEEQKALLKIANSVELLASEVKYMGNNLTDVKHKQDEVISKVDNLEQTVNTIEISDAVDVKKRVDAIKEKSTWVVISGILLYLLSQILPHIYK